jgi:NADP-dependent 3-hydroxy acid dehydrogenase YdfG
LAGTSSGFGAILVNYALERGDLVIASARNLASIQDKFTSSDPELNDRLHLLQLDLNWDAGKIKAAVDEGAKVWGRIDVLINNAGFGILGFMEEVP